MIKRFPSRNNRSKGVKVKHVLQIILLLGVSFWLIYQVKHNHDKKKEFDKNDANLSVRTQADQILKLGRKDLHPGKNEANQNEKHGEEEEDEHIEEDEGNKHEHDEQEETNLHETEEQEDNNHEGIEQGEEENKNGAEEQEEDESKSEEMEDDGRVGGGDGENEIDENDQEKIEVDIDRDDGFMDEEKEKEEEGDEKNRFVDEEREKEEDGGEKEKGNMEDEEKGGLVETDSDHEAREEHYKGDDASSAVTHDTHATSTETETFSLDNSDVNLGMNITKPENQTTHSDESDMNKNYSDLKVTEPEAMDRISSNATTDINTENNSLSNLGDSSYLNKTVATNSDSRLESSSNLTVVITEARNNFAGAGANISSSSEQNETVILSESDLAQNTTVNTTINGDVENVQGEGLEQSGNRISEEKLPDTNSTVSVKTENGDATATESSNLGGVKLENTTGFVASNETENTSQNLDRNENSDTSETDVSKGDTETSETNETLNIDAMEDEMFNGDTRTGETDETSEDSFALDSVERDAIDSSDTHIHEDVAEVRTDLDTLPDMRNGGDNGDETAAE